MADFTQSLQQAFSPNRIKTSELLSLHTSFKTGGPASWYVEVTTLEEILKAVELAKEHAIPFCILGSGTTALFADEGYEGLVIKNMCRRFELVSMTGKIRNGKIDVDKAYVYCESGALMNQVVRYVIEEGYGGIEFALGLPGTVGGAVATNADYPLTHTSIGDRVHKAQVLTPQGELKEVGQEYFHFTRNGSSLLTNGDILLSVFFTLTPEQKTSLWKKADEAVSYRSQFQEPNAFGLTYRVMKLSAADEALRGGSLPSLESLLSHSRLLGAQVNGVALSEKNSRIYLNKGNGTTHDLLTLFDTMKTQLQKKYTILISIHTGQIKV